MRQEKRTIASTRGVFVPSDRALFDELRKVSRETGMSFGDISIARSIERTSGVDYRDTLNHMRLRALTQRIAADG
jgi:hypothetical protein